MAVYAIGDLQGCFKELRELLDKLDFDAGRDRLWLTGDLVNRGPASLKVLRFVKRLGNAAKTVLGNHDLFLIALALGVRVPGARQGGLRSVLDAADRDELIDWLRSRPLVYFKPKRGLLVHAGLAPQWDVAQACELAREVEATLRGPRAAALLKASFGKVPQRWSDSLSSWERQLFTLTCLTRARLCGPGGALSLDLKGPPEAAPEGFVPWFRYPRRASAGTRIVFGHWAALGLLVENELVAVDTGCVWGGTLTAVRLSKKRVKVAAEVRARISRR